MAVEIPLNIVTEDAVGCCAKIRKALPKLGDQESWTCPKCGLDWKPDVVGGMRVWRAHPVFQVWRK